MLEFNVRNQSISRIDNMIYAEKSINYLEAKFNFLTEDWRDLTKSATFENKKGKIVKDVILNNDKCLVPWEVLEEKGKIEVSVYGVDINTKITTNIASFNLYDTISGGSATQDPTPDVYQQIIDMIEDIAVSGVTDEQIARAVEKYLAENPIDGVNEDEVKRIVDEYVAENAEQFKGEDGKDGIDGQNGEDGKDGKDGFSPSAKVEQTAEGAVITITDAEGTTTAIVKNGKDGADGEDGKDGVSGEGGTVVVADSINYRWKTVGTYHPKCQYNLGASEPVTVGNQYTALSYALNGEEKIKFSGACGGVAQRVAYAFVDDNNADLGHGKYSSMATFSDVVVDVPSGATKVFINGNGQSSPFLEVAVKDTMGDLTTLQYLLNQFGRKLQYNDTFAWKTMPTGLVAFTFDDSVDATNEIVDLFIRKGVPCCFGAIPELLHKSLSSNETVAQAMQRGVNAVGCEVLAHGGYIVTQDNINDENYLYEKFVPYRQKLVNAGFNVRGIVRTGGAGQLDNSPITEQWVKLLFDYSDLYGTKEPYNHARVSSTTEQGYKDAIDSAIANKKFASLLFHQPPEYLEGLIDYAIQKGAIVCNYAYAYDTYGSTKDEVAILQRLEALEKNDGGNGGNDDNGGEDEETPIEKTLLSITATKTKTAYSVGEQVNVDDIKVMATYSDGTSKDVTSEADINTSQIGTGAGTYGISITYTEGDVSKTASISITIIDGESSDYIMYNGSFSGGELTHNMLFGPEIDVVNGKTYSIEADYEFDSVGMYASHTITLRAGNWSTSEPVVFDSVTGVTSGHLSVNWVSSSGQKMTLFSINLKNTTVSGYRFTNVYIKEVN